MQEGGDAMEISYKIIGRHIKDKVLLDPRRSAGISNVLIVNLHKKNQNVARLLHNVTRYDSTLHVRSQRCTIGIGYRVAL